MRRVSIYLIEGCWSCSRAEKILAESGDVVSRHVIGRDVTVAEVLEDYPQMSCESCPGGIKLPVIVVDGVLLGSLHELMEEKAHA